MIDDDIIPFTISLGESPAWFRDAACRGLDPSLFFTERGESTEPARAVCMTCPVRQQCLDYAVENHEKFGVWGGVSGRERRAMWKHRFRGDGRYERHRKLREEREREEREREANREREGEDDC